jgi:hypothetical protein
VTILPEIARARDSNGGVLRRSTNLRFGKEAVQRAVFVVCADGWPIRDQELHLIVSGEHRGGRSVRDMVRIDIE